VLVSRSSQGLSGKQRAKVLIELTQTMGPHEEAALTAVRPAPHHAAPRRAAPRHATPRHAAPRHAAPRHAAMHA